MPPGGFGIATGAEGFGNLGVNGLPGRTAGVGVGSAPGTQLWEHLSEVPHLSGVAGSC